MPIQIKVIFSESLFVVKLRKCKRPKRRAVLHVLQVMKDNDYEVFAFTFQFLRQHTSVNRVQ